MSHPAHQHHTFAAEDHETAAEQHRAAAAALAKGDHATGHKHAVLALGYANQASDHGDNALAAHVEHHEEAEEDGPVASGAGFAPAAA